MEDFESLTVISFKVIFAWFKCFKMINILKHSKCNKVFIKQLNVISCVTLIK